MNRFYCGIMIGFLFYAFVTPIYALGPWVRNTVEFRPTSDPMIGYDADIAIDGSGYPHIVYNYYGGDTRYAFWNGSSWTIRNISYGASYGVGITLDALDDVHIVIGCIFDDVRYAYSSDGGSSWTLETIEESWWHCDIDVDNSNVPHLAYCRLNTDYRHAVRLSPSSYTAPH